RLHARLHALTPDGLPEPPGSFLSRRLGEIDNLIRTYGLRGLLPGLDWLVRQRPGEPGWRHVLHLDWHPLNLMRAGDGTLTALDWNEADVGDRHADVATALLLVRCAPAPLTRRWQRL